MAITVPGASGGIITVTPGTGDYLGLAVQIANLLNSANDKGNVNVSVMSSAGATVPTTAGSGGKINELGIIGTGGGSTVQAGPAAGTGWQYVVNVPNTVAGGGQVDTVLAQDQVVLSGDAGARIIALGNTTVAATGGDNNITGGAQTVITSGVGAPSNQYLISTGAGNDTISAFGTGTITGGTGTNVMNVSSSGANYVISAGKGDRVQFYGSGTRSLPSTTGGDDQVSVGGTFSTVDGAGVGFPLQLNSTLAGSNNIVLMEGQIGGSTITGTADTLSGGTASSMTASIVGAGNAVVAGQVLTTSVVSASTGGSNAVFASSLTGSLLQATLAGANDTVLGGRGTVQILATGASVVALGSTTGGSLQVTTSGSADTVNANSATVTGIIGGAKNFLFGGTGLLSNVTISGSQDFVGVQSAAGSSLVVTGTGDNVLGGTGALNITVTGSGDTVAAGTGTTNFSIGGSADYLFGDENTVSSSASMTGTFSGSAGTLSLRGEKSSAISLSGSGNVVFGPQSTLSGASITVSGSSDTVYSGIGSTTVTSATSDALAFGASGGGALYFIGGNSGTATVVGGFGTSTGGSLNPLTYMTVNGASASSGAVLFHANQFGSASIVGGTGHLTVFDNNGSNVYYTTAGGNTTGGAEFHGAGGGSMTVNASASQSNDVFWQSSVAGNNTYYIGGSGNDTWGAAAGNATFVGGAGSNQFHLWASVTGTATAAGGTHITIQNWNANDAIFMHGYASKDSALQTIDASYLANHASGNAQTGFTVTLSDNTTVTFTNLQAIKDLDGKIGYFNN